jgi:hypothetical protein
VLDGKPVKGVAEFKLATVTSVAERVMSLEHVRAGIPVENLLGALMTAAYTGEMDGVAVSPKERIDILKFLTNKVMPDVKTVDGDAKSEKADMKVKKLRDFTKEEIKKLSEDELRKLLMEAADG